MLPTSLILKKYMDFKILLLTPMNYIIEIQCSENMDPAEKFYMTLQMYSFMPFILLFGNILVLGVKMWIEAACNPQIGGKKFSFKILVNRVSIS
jgi:hypothetical protein